MPLNVVVSLRLHQCRMVKNIYIFPVKVLNYAEYYLKISYIHQSKTVRKVTENETWRCKYRKENVIISRIFDFLSQ